MRKYGALGGTITESVLKSVTQVQQQANAHSVCPADNHALGSHSVTYSHTKFYTLQHLYYTLYAFQCMHVNLKSWDLLTLTFLQNPKGGGGGREPNLRHSDLALLTLEFWKTMIWSQ